MDTASSLTNIIVYASFVANILLAVFLLLVIVRLWRKQDQLEKIIPEFGEKTATILDHLEQSSDVIVHTTQQKAEQILSQAGQVRATIDTALQDKLQALATTEVQQFSSTTSQITSNLEKALHQIESQTHTVESNNAQLMSDSLKQISTQELEYYKKQVNELLAQIKLQLEEYKTEKMKETEADAQKLAQNMALKLLGKNLTNNDHQELVQQALIEAQNKGVFA